MFMSAFKMGFGGGGSPFEFLISTSFIDPPAGGGASTLRNCPYPAGSQEGDLIIAIVGCASTATPTISGWTIAQTQAVGSFRSRILYQFYPSGSPATAPITVAPASEGLGGVMLRIPRAAFDAIGVFDVNTSPCSPVGPNASGGLALAIFRGSAATSSWTTPSGMTPVFSRNGVDGFNCYVFSEIAPSGAVGARSSAASPAGSYRHGIVLTIKEN